MAKLGHYHQELANCLAKRDKEDEEHEKLINEMKADIQAEYDRQTRVVKADFDRDERSMRMVFEADIQMLTALYRNKLERVVKVKDADLADIKIFIDTSLSERSESLEAIAALRRIDRATEDAIFSRLRAELDLVSLILQLSLFFSSFSLRLIIYSLPQPQWPRSQPCYLRLHLHHLRSHLGLL